MFDFIQLHQLDMETSLMERLLVCVYVVLCIMILRLERRILQRMVSAAISFATPSQETKFRLQVRSLSFFKQIHENLAIAYVLDLFCQPLIKNIICSAADYSYLN